jgi:hypothetical protein
MKFFANLVDQLCYNEDETLMTQVVIGLDIHQLWKKIKKEVMFKFLWFLCDASYDDRFFKHHFQMWKK